MDDSRLKNREAYQNPTLDCDMVMKGGITSGVVYPLAICELATKYRFHSLGGSSAGAIAASACAAAELGRENGGGFQQLATMPKYLGEEGRLLKLFQPEPQTRPLLGLLLFGLENRDAGAVGWILEALRQVWQADGGKAWLIKTGAGLAAVVLAYVLLVHWVNSYVLSFVLLVALGVALAVLTSRAASTLAHTVLAILKDNSFGICTGLGSAAAKPVSGKDRIEPGPGYALTDWLTDELNELAGLDKSQPLCFGHLAAKQIRLEMFTTSLTHGRPFRMPMNPSVSFNTDGFFFHPDEMRKLFPERIVKWMIEHPPRRASSGQENGDGPEHVLLCRLMKARWNLYPLPAAEFLPVVVATRMSLSFPGLICAVPLWGLDWTDTANLEARVQWRSLLSSHSGEITDDQLAVAMRNLREPHAKRVWMSDGGICSNFPIHFFDGPIPRWPTFGINLRSDTTDARDESNNVFLATESSEGRDLSWAAITEVPGFALSIIDTMYNWNDNAQMRVHGFWDRVAHIKLDDKNEGGLNLNMPDKLVGQLGERGFHAGRKLAARFDPARQDDRPNWDSHRWARFRTMMSLLEDTISRIDQVMDFPAQAGSRQYNDLVFRVQSDSPDTGYWWANNAQRDLAHTATRELREAARRWRQTGERLEKKAPRPRPHLRMTPPI